MKTNLRTLKPADTSRRLGRLGAFALVLGLAAPLAHADWYVVDKDANSKLDELKNKLDDANTKLGQIQNIGSYKELGKIVPDPDQPLVKQTLQQDVTQCQSRPSSQQALCEEIIKTRNAQMAYMVTMFEYAKTRDQQLRDIETERQNIASTDVGKLEDNTNKLLALNTQLAIDQQQLQSVMYAYETRLKYLRDQQTKLAEAAQTGNPPDKTTGLFGGLDPNVAQALTALTTGVVLKGALIAVKTPTPSDMRRLHVGDSNGY
jgi:protein-arginine kinase activator protein McsA